MITKKEFENFMKEYGFKNIDDLKEEEIIKEIVELKQQLGEKDKEIEKVENYYKSREKDIVNDADEIIKKLEKQLAEKDKEIKELKKEKELDNIFWKQECDSLQKTLAEKDKEIQDWKDGTMIVRYEKELAEKDEQLNDVEEHIDSLELQLREQYQIVDEKDEEIEELKEHIKFLENKCLNEINVKLVNVTKEKLQQIRKQVCDEIREKAIIHFHKNPDHQHIPMSYEIMVDVIDQVEKGE